MSTARELEMYYSLGTSAGNVTRLNVASVVRFSLYISRAAEQGAIAPLHLIILFDELAPPI